MRNSHGKRSGDGSRIDDNDGTECLVAQQIRIAGFHFRN